jgi:Zn-finger nucleic acid-binding protein
MNCPKCLGILEPIQVTEQHTSVGKNESESPVELSLEVDKCFSCGGVWFDDGELDKYLDEKITAVDSPSLGKDVDRRLDKALGNCPRCTIELTPSPSSTDRKVTIDICPTCHGVWLDPTEIDRLERANKYGDGFVGSFLEALM